MNTDALIFDLDGTLWDASQSCVMAWNSALGKIGIVDFKVTAELAARFSGKLLSTIFSEYLFFIPNNKLETLAILYEEEETVFMRKNGGHLYPNTRYALENLSTKYKLFIVSNCVKGYIENFFHWHQLGNLFTDYTCSGITGKSKAENIAALILRNNLENPVYIGDTPGDFEASIQNGIPFVYARYGFGKVSSAEFLIDDLSELGDVLKKIFIS